MLFDKNVSMYKQLLGKYFKPHSNFYAYFQTPSLSLLDLKISHTVMEGVVYGMCSTLLFKFIL